MSSAAPSTIDARRTASKRTHVVDQSTGHSSAGGRNLRWNAAVTLCYRLILLGIILSLFTYISSLSVLDNCNTESHHAQGSAERTAQYADDKHNQSVFIFLFHSIFVILALCSFLDYGSSHTNQMTVSSFAKISIFWLVDAIAAYVWRVALYLCVVRPLGYASESENCGTSKSISGHTHFYCYHLLQMIYLVWLTAHQPFINQKSKQLATMGDSGDPQIFARVLRWCLQLYALFVVFWTLTTLEQTYALGFHSLRHMLAGFAAALFSIGSYVSLLLLWLLLLLLLWLWLWLP